MRLSLPVTSTPSLILASEIRSFSLERSPVKGSTWVGSCLARKYYNKLDVAGCTTDSTNYKCKMCYSKSIRAVEPLPIQQFACKEPNLTNPYVKPRKASTWVGCNLAPKILE
jgi:hypothetical protein